MNLEAVMSEIGTRLDSIVGLRVHAFPADKVTPPAAVVSYPEQIEYHSTYARGSDRMSLPVIVVVGRPTDRTTVGRLGKYADGSGPDSVVAVVESGTYTAFDEAVVTRVEFDVFTIGGTDYMAALFTLDIMGRGAV